MDGTRPQSSAGADRLSKLGDRELGHVLSFLPAKEAQRAALLSSRWRDLFAAVHTVSLEEPEAPLQEQDNDDDCYSNHGRPAEDPNAPPPFHCAVSNALLARNGRRGAAPLRALRVDMEGGGGARYSTVDQWVKYAVQHAAPEGLRLDLRLRRVPLCDRNYSLQRSSGLKPDMSAANMAENPPSASLFEVELDDEQPPPNWWGTISSNQVSPVWESYPQPQQQGSKSTDFDYAGDGALSPRSATSSRRSNKFYDRSPSPVSSSSDDNMECDEIAGYPNYSFWEEPTASTVLFSCSALRSLSLGHLDLFLPEKVNLPSLETLLLFHVSDPGESVEWIIAGSPRLADLTLEACNGVFRLYVPSGARLRRLALRCCHNLAAVVLDASELVAFEYRGAVPDNTFLTMNGGGSQKVAYCKVDFCGQEVCSVTEVTKLARLLQLFTNAKHLHLEP
ncbi:unnamed protein product [Urochloa humidicola]